MVSDPLSLSQVRKVAVFRALKVGDLLCAVPALRALRAALPEATIVLIGLPWAQEFAERYRHLVDEFREFPGYPGLPERAPRIERLPAFFAAMQAEKFDLAVQLHGSGPIVNPVCVLLGARHTAGFYLHDDDRPANGHFLPWPHEGTEVTRLLRLTGFLGAPARGEHLELPLRASDFRAVAEAFDMAAGEYVCVHAGASVPERRWPAEHFASVADALAERGLRVVLTGSAGEAELTQAVARAMAAPSTNLVGRTHLGAVGALLARARLLVGNDTGVSHVADAVRTPSVIVSSGDNPARWAPSDTARHRTLNRADGIAVSDVLREAQHLLETFPRTP